jgi:sucrose-phosphate synthase
MSHSGQTVEPLRITLISLHGLIRANDPELGRDADTGGQIKYVLELASELGKRDDVERVELITRQIFDEKVGPDYAQVEQSLGEKAKIMRLPFSPKRYLRKEGLWPYLEKLGYTFRTPAAGSTVS